VSDPQNLLTARDDGIEAFVEILVDDYDLEVAIGLANQRMEHLLNFLRTPYRAKQKREPRSFQ
jgi:hypothetical protein